MIENGRVQMSPDEQLARHFAECFAMVMGLGRELMKYEDHDSVAIAISLAKDALTDMAWSIVHRPEPSLPAGEEAQRHERASSAAGLWLHWSTEHPE